MTHPTVFLDIDQYQHLQDIAQSHGNSLNETLHEVIHLGIDALQRRKQNRLNALKKLTEIRQDIAQKHGEYADEILEIIREERMQKITPFSNIKP